MHLSTFSDLIAQGYSNSDIAKMMISTGFARSFDNARKSSGIIRRMLEKGQPEDLMVLTGTKVNGKEEVISKKYARRKVEQFSTEGLEIERATTNPNGSPWIKYKSSINTAKILKQEMTEAVSPLSIKYTSAEPTGDLALHIVITDHHFGKIPFSYKDEDWTLETAKAEFQKAIQYHLSKAPVEDVSTIIFPVGNDLLHINSTTGQTKRGTAMEYSENYHRLYRFVRECVAGCILSLSEQFSLIVPIIGGNHDEDACYRLGDYLEGLFYGSDRVKIKNNGHDRKYTLWGNSLIQHCHGEKIKFQALHEFFTVDVPDLMSKARYRYSYVGHLHKEKQGQVVTRTINDEYRGTKITICPALCPTDNWHFDNGFTGNQRSSISFLYSKDKGRFGQFTYSI